MCHLNNKTLPHRDAVWELHENRYCSQGLSSNPRTIKLPSHFKNCSAEALAEACTRLCEARDGCTQVAVKRPFTVSGDSDLACHICDGNKADDADEFCRAPGCSDYDSYRLQPSAATQPQQQEEASVALCIVGVANHAMSSKYDKPGLHPRPIFDNATYSGIAAWRKDLLRVHGVRTEVFLVLDLSVGWLPNDGHLSRPHQAGKGGGGSKAWRSAHNRTRMSTLRPMLDRAAARA